MTTRKRRGMVELATDTYVKDGRHVILFGVSHVSSHEFWAKSNAFLAELEAKGFEVQFERIENDIEDAPKLVPDYALLAEVMGLQDQKSGLEYKDHWLRTDTTLSNLLSGADPEKLAQAVKTAADMEAKVRELLKSENIALYREGFLKMMRLAPYVTPLLALLQSSSPDASMLGGISRKTIVQDRNEIASDAILASDRNVVAVWGANHLPGIGKTLKANRFKLKYRQWHPAY